jgi:hypothetical protein
MKFLSDRGFDGIGVESDGGIRQQHRILNNLRLRMYGIADAKVNLYGLSNVGEPRLQANTGTRMSLRLCSEFVATLRSRASTEATMFRARPTRRRSASRRPGCLPALILFPKIVALEMTRSSGFSANADRCFPQSKWPKHDSHRHP